MLLRFSHNFLSFPFLSRRKKPILVLCDPRGAVLSCFSNEKLLLFPPSETGSRKRVRTRLVFHDEKRANPSPPPLTIFFVEGNGCIERIPRDKFFFLSLVSCLLAAGWTSFRDGKIRDTVSRCSFLYIWGYIRKRLLWSKGYVLYFWRNDEFTMIEISWSGKVVELGENSALISFHSSGYFAWVGDWNINVDKPRRNAYNEISIFNCIRFNLLLGE